MNHVNLIGKMCSTPKFVELKNGKKLVQFTLSTKETFLDAEGKAQTNRQWHKLFAWGKRVKVLEELGSEGMNIAIEERLTSRFYKLQTGDRKYISEVEVNDIIIL